jgi:hypothetical protein
VDTKKVRITAGHPFRLPDLEDFELHPGDRVELPRQVADSLIAAGMAEELLPTAKVRRRRKYHLGTPEDRCVGAVLYALDFTEADIARVLGKDRATIWRWKRRAVIVPRGWGKKRRWESWEVFRSDFGPPTLLAVAGLLAKEPFAQAVQEALRRAAAKGQYAIYNRLLNMVQTAVGAAVLGVLADLPCPRCRRAIRPLDRARVALLHEDCFRQAFRPGAGSLPVRPCL